MDGLIRPSRAHRALLAFALALLGCAAIASTAQAAPAWKLLAATGPTNLPPKQSEIQRVTVEAEGGTFTLTPTMAEGHGTLNYALGIVETVEGSNQAHLYFTFAGTFKVGQTFFGEGIPAGTTIVGIAGTPSEPDLELSNNATESGNSFHSGASKEVTGVTTSAGQFAVGQGVSGPGVEPGTTVAAVGGGTLTLSAYPTGAGTGDLDGTATTAPIPYDASAATLQGVLEALPGFTSGMFTFSGGPGGDAEHPYFVSFGGPFAETDVAKLAADGGGLLGAHASVAVFTMVPGGPGTGVITINPANVGGATTLGPVTMNFGPLPPGIRMAGPVAAAENWTCSGGAGESSFTCTTNAQTPAFSPATSIRFPVEVEPAVASSASAPVEIFGGGAGSASYEMSIVVSREQAPAGAQAFWAGAFDDDGNREVQAGGHAYSAQSYFLLNTIRAGSGEIVPAGVSKNVIVDLPPGFLGNPMVTKRCPQAQVTVGFEPSPLCNSEMSVGTFQPLIKFFGNTSSDFTVPIFNDVPPQGYAAEFTARIVEPRQSLLGSVRSDGDYGVRITAPNNPNFYKIYGSYAALEGEPAGAHGKAFLTNPSDCAQEAQRAPTASFQSDTWENIGQYSSTVYEHLPPVTGCDKLEFHPSFSFLPTDSTGSSPVGAIAHMNIPQEGLTDPDKLATPALKKAVVELPAGLVLNPSSANGLQACSEAQIGYVGPGEMPNPTRFNKASPTCPDGSKLGTAEVKTPLLEAPLPGTVYLAAQEENPFDSLIAIYLVIDDARTGITMKLPGEVKPDPNTGQLTAIFDNNPQLPFEDLTLNIRGGGPRAQLATPEVCGAYKTTGSLTPWSAPESGPPAQIEEAGFNVSSGCSASAAARPFAPSFEALTTATKAGAYTPLVIKVARKDGEQELTRLDFTLPKGLIGKLAGIPYCTEAQIAAAEAKTGRAEQANSSCPAASRLGSVDTAAGVGSEPVHVGGTAYLAGPYKGAPVSTVVVTPGIAGPFDLGNVVIRAPLYVDPESAQLTAKSDPIPTILKGIPLKVRSVMVNVDRPGFILNPTSCEVKSASASIAGGSGATATPSNRFQVGDCSNLKFTPKLELSLKGGTKRNSNPALTAVLTQPAAQANIGRVSVTLPHSEFLDQSHIRTVCTRVQFAAQACPSGAIYGEAEAFTPLLDQPLRGPVYLRSSSNKLPDLVVALKGPASQPIEVALAGRIDSVKGGIRNSFELVPDAPVSKFVLRMQGGKKGLLVNSTDICRKTNRATVKMEGQNGKLANSSPSVRGQCKSSKKKSKGNKRRSRSKLFGGW